MDKLKKSSQNPQESSTPASPRRHLIIQKIVEIVPSLLLAGIILLGLASLLSGCAAKEPELHPFVNGEVVCADAKDAIEQLSRLCLAQPEVLASTASAFPRLFEGSEIFESSDPIYLDDRMDNEDGADVQFALMMSMTDILVLSDTKYALDTWSGEAEVLYMTERTANPKSPEDFGLAWGKTTLENEQILAISWHPYGAEEGDCDIGLFLVSGGFQRIKPILEPLGVLPKHP